jgi:hypothetical protein
MVRPQETKQSSQGGIMPRHVTVDKANFGSTIRQQIIGFF